MVEDILSQLKAVAKAPLVHLAVMFFSACAIWIALEYRYKSLIEAKDATIQSKDATIELLRTKLETNKKVSDAKPRARELKGQLPAPVRENFTGDSLAILVGPENVRNAFMDLTASGRLTVPIDPNENYTSMPLQGRDYETAAALQSLIEMGYAGEAQRQGTDGFLIKASSEALKIRTSYDQLPAAIRNKINSPK